MYTIQLSNLYSPVTIPGLVKIDPALTNQYYTLHMKNSNPEEEKSKKTEKPSESSEDSEYDVEYDNEQYIAVEVRDVKTQTTISINPNNNWPASKSDTATQVEKEASSKDQATQTDQIEKGRSSKDQETQTENDASLTKEITNMEDSTGTNEWDEDKYYDEIMRKYIEHENNLMKDPKNPIEFTHPEEKTLDEQIEEVNKRGQTWEEYFEQKGGIWYWIWLIFCFCFSGLIPAYLIYEKLAKWIAKYDAWARNQYLINRYGYSLIKIPSTADLLFPSLITNSPWTSLGLGCGLFLFKKLQKHINKNIRNTYIVAYRGLFFRSVLWFFGKFFK